MYLIRLWVFCNIVGLCKDYKENDFLQPISMKIYYSPEYNGHLYIDFQKHGNIAFDCEYKNTSGLVGMLATMLGVYQKDISAGERLAEYYSVFSKYMEQNQNNVFSASFEKAALTTAQKCLQWRDELAEYGWTFDMPTASQRMKVLSDVEKDFHCPGNVEFHKKVFEALKKNPTILKGSHIIVPFKKKMLKPFVQQLLTLLEDGGCKIEYKLQDDYTKLLSPEKLEVLWFTLKEDAIQYLTSLPDDAYNVWINGDNKLQDNWLRMAGHPVAGSTLSNASPITLQLLALGINLFNKPLDLNTLLQWLTTPVHPLPGKFRYDLADMIVGKGGYRNEECQELIDAYIAGDYLEIEDAEKLTPEELDEKKNSNLKKRELYASLFLPDIDEFDHITENQQQEDILIDRAKLWLFAKELCTWCQQRIIILNESAEEKQIREQLFKLLDMLNSFSKLTQQEERDKVQYSLVEGWVASLSSTGDFCQYHAQAGCRDTISSGAAIVDNAKTAIWCDVYGVSEHRLSCSFLSALEYNSLKDKMTFWNKVQERAYYNAVMMYPFAHVDEKLVIVKCDKSGSTNLAKHPVMIWLENNVNIEDFYKQVSFDGIPEIEMENFWNGSQPKYAYIENAEKINWPTHESHSSLETLIQYPIDYVMDYVLKLRGSNTIELEGVKRTQGNVAHAVIAELFSPSADTTDYSEAFDKVINAYGAVLLQKENIMAMKQLKTELKVCIDNLKEIISSNNLEVLECEYPIDETDIGLRTADDIAIPVKGFVDMTLKDENGDVVVFDFKWTSSKRYYVGKLQNNTAAQLVLYQQLIKAKDNKNVAKCAYFLMPEGHLYSTSHFKGENSYRIDIDENAVTDIFEKIKNSYKYRREEIMGGRVENGEGLEPEYLDYGCNTEERNLMPLATYNDLKTENGFSNFGFLKR